MLGNFILVREKNLGNLKLSGNFVDNSPQFVFVTVYQIRTPKVSVGIHIKSELRKILVKYVWFLIKIRSIKIDPENITSFNVDR